MQLFKIMSQRPFFFSIIFSISIFYSSNYLRCYCTHNKGAFKYVLSYWMNINLSRLSNKKCFLMYCNLLVAPWYKQDFINIMHLGSLVGENCGDQELKYSATSSLPVMLLLFSYQHWLRENKKMKTNESGSRRL